MWPAIPRRPGDCPPLIGVVKPEPLGLNAEIPPSNIPASNIRGMYAADCPITEPA